MNYHHLKVQILEKLSYLGKASFSKLKPAELMNNSFNYYLKALLQENLIEKTDASYQLTDKGLVYVDKLSFKTSKPRQQPKLICIILVKNHQGDYLLAKRKTEPFIGRFAFINGKQHFGEAPEIHTRRELREQLATEITPIYRGAADIRTHHEQMLVSHVAARIYSAVFDGAAPKDSQKFSYEWRSPAAFEPLLAGDSAVYRELEKSDKPIYLSLDLDD